MRDCILIFTDGASRGNPGRGGWGAVLVISEDKDNKVIKSKVVELGGREENTTNNRMELKAAIEALKHLQPSTFNLQVFTDSSYVINGITKWIRGWRMNGWKTKTKKEVLNRDLWEELAGLTQGQQHKNIEWKYLGGHSGIAGNERCDEIATESADGKVVNLYNGPLSKYPVDILNFNFDESKAKEKASARSHQKALAYSYVSMVDGKIKTHKTWAECEKRVKGKSGAKFKKSTSAIQEKEIIKSWN